MADTAGLPMNLLGYGADSQIVKSGVTVLPRGNVGIGTTNPSTIEAPLHVFGNTPGYTLSNPLPTALVVSGYSGGRVYMNSHFSSGSFYGVIQASDYYFGLDHGSTLSLNPLGGGVGIGTTNPATKVHVEGGSTTGILASFLSSTLASGTNNSINIGKAWAINDSATLLHNHIANGSSSNYFGIGYYGADNKLNVTAGGNVGIGITNPTAKLHVDGTINSSNTTPTINTVASTVYSIQSGKSGFIVITGFNFKYMGYFEWTSGSTSATLNQLVANNTVNTLTVSLNTTDIQATCSSSVSVNVRVILF